MAYDNSDREMLDFSDLHFDDVAEGKAALAEENAFPSGTYNAVPLKVEAERIDGREMGIIQYGLLSETGKVMKKVRFKFSWIVGYSHGRVDKPFKMYVNLKKALGVTEDGPEVLMQANEVPVRVQIAEAYIAEAGNVHPDHSDKSSNDQGQVWIILDAPNGSNNDDVSAHRAFYIGLGLEPIYFCQNVFADR